MHIFCMMIFLFKFPGFVYEGNIDFLELTGQKIEEITCDSLKQKYKHFIVICNRFKIFCDKCQNNCFQKIDFNDLPIIVAHI